MLGLGLVRLVRLVRAGLSVARLLRPLGAGGVGVGRVALLRLDRLAWPYYHLITQQRCAAALRCAAAALGRTVAREEGLLTIVLTILLLRGTAIHTILLLFVLLYLPLSRTISATAAFGCSDGPVMARCPQIKVIPVCSSEQRNDTAMAQ